MNFKLTMRAHSDIIRKLERKVEDLVNKRKKIEEKLTNLQNVFAFTTCLTVSGTKKQVTIDQQYAIISNLTKAAKELVVIKNTLSKYKTKRIKPILTNIENELATITVKLKEAYKLMETMAANEIPTTLKRVGNIIKKRLEKTISKELTISTKTFASSKPNAVIYGYYLIISPVKDRHGTEHKVYVGLTTLIWKRNGTIEPTYKVYLDTKFILPERVQTGIGEELTRPKDIYLYVLQQAKSKQLSFFRKAPISKTKVSIDRSKFDPELYESVTTKDDKIYLVLDKADSVKDGVLNKKIEEKVINDVKSSVKPGKLSYKYIIKGGQLIFIFTYVPGTKLTKDDLKKRLMDRKRA